MELVSGGTAEKDFYSHAREGRDEGNLKLVRSINISTHTPARGVTRIHKGRLPCTCNFYSHAREGRDFVSAGATWKCTNFYSHAREGRDLHGADNTGATDAFLLTRPRGA